MVSWVIELNAAEVRVGKGGAILVRSPGYAVVEGERIWLGEEARNQAYLHPHRTYNRFWSDLAQDRLRTSSRRFRHHADLAYAHLLALYEQAGQPKEVIFAVPGSFSPPQLSLLLGIARACPFAAVGLVDSAVAGAASVAGGGRYLHLDIDLCHTVLTELEVDGERVRRGAVETVDEVGLNTLYEAGANLIAETFIRQSRFDPRHHGESEQALYNQLPRWLASSRSEVPADIFFQGVRYQARFSREALLEVLQPYYAKIGRRLTAGQELLLSHRMAALPGFVASNLPPHRCLTVEAVFTSCQAHEKTIRSPGPNLKFVTHLPAQGRPASAAVTSRQAAEPSPPMVAREEAGTHLLCGHRAFALGERPLYLSGNGGVSTLFQPSSLCSLVWHSPQAIISPLGSAEVYVNGALLRSARSLRAGDEIRFADSETVYALIQLVQPDAS